PRTPRCGEVVKQARHRTAGPVCREQLVATEGGFPFALAAGDKNGCARLVGKPVERALDCYLAAASLPGSRARIGQHVGPHSSVVGSCGCGQERLSTASRACSIAPTKLAISRLLESSKTKFGLLPVTMLAPAQRAGGTAHACPPFCTHRSA